MTDKPEDPGGDPFPALTVEDEQNVPVDHSLIRDVASRALTMLGVPAEAALAVTLVDETRMADLKQKALGEHAPTDVLAFPIDDLSDPMPGPLVLGDVVMCPGFAAEQARAAGQGLDEEISMLLVHGILHCLGRDHADPAEETAMFAEQADILHEIEAERAVGH
jgi:probable rRNA maturation factor